jgi:hypothetical protein
MGRLRLPPKHTPSREVKSRAYRDNDAAKYVPIQLQAGVGQGQDLQSVRRSTFDCFYTRQNVEQFFGDGALAIVIEL